MFLPRWTLKNPRALKRPSNPKSRSIMSSKNPKRFASTLWRRRNWQPGTCMTKKLSKTRALNRMRIFKRRFLLSTKRPTPFALMLWKMQKSTSMTSTTKKCRSQILPWRMRGLWTKRNPRQKIRLTRKKAKTWLAPGLQTRFQNQCKLQKDGWNSFPTKLLHLLSQCLIWLIPRRLKLPTHKRKRMHVVSFTIPKKRNNLLVRSLRLRILNTPLSDLLHSKQPPLSPHHPLISAKGMTLEAPFKGCMRRLHQRRCPRSVHLLHRLRIARTTQRMIHPLLALRMPTLACS